MKSNYPESLNPWFQGFHPQVRLRIGPELDGNGLVRDDVVVLSETETSRPDVSYSEDAALPERRAIYTDNGQDEGWSLKLEFYGWGTFFKVPGEGTYYLEVVKRLDIHRNDWDTAKTFEQVSVAKTEIPSSEDIPGVEMGTVTGLKRGSTVEPDLNSSQQSRYPKGSYQRTALQGGDFVLGDDCKWYWKGSYTYA